MGTCPCALVMFPGGAPCTIYGPFSSARPGPAARRRHSPAMLRFGAPVLFVLIWSSGFIVAKAVWPHVDLQAFLLARLFLTGLVMGVAALVARVAWPRG